MVESGQYSDHRKARLRNFDYVKILSEIAEQCRPHLGKGAVASYIPALKVVPARKFGMAIAALDGAILKAGDVGQPFSIQSIVKLFSLRLALTTIGDALWERVGMEPSGDRFNSLYCLEFDQGRPKTVH